MRITSQASKTANQKSRAAYTTAAHLILTRGQQVLLLRRFNTGWEDGKYSVIAGHLDGAETAMDAMVREAFEEAGVTLRREDLRFVHVMHRRKPHGEEKLDFFFHCDRWGGEIVNAEPHKCDELAWFEIESRPTHMIPYVDHAIRCFQNNVPYSEFGWDEGARGRAVETV